jgi:hypothetical protein
MLKIYLVKSVLLVGRRGIHYNVPYNQLILNRNLS